MVLLGMLSLEAVPPAFPSTRGLEEQLHEGDLESVEEAEDSKRVENVGFLTKCTWTFPSAFSCSRLAPDKTQWPSLCEHCRPRVAGRGPEKEGEHRRPLCSRSLLGLG